MPSGLPSRSMLAAASHTWDSAARGCRSGVTSLRRHSFALARSNPTRRYQRRAISLVRRKVPRSNPAYVPSRETRPRGWRFQARYSDGAFCAVARNGGQPYPRRGLDPVLCSRLHARRGAGGESLPSYSLSPRRAFERSARSARSTSSVKHPRPALTRSRYRAASQP